MIMISIDFTFAKKVGGGGYFVYITCMMASRKGGKMFRLSNAKRYIYKNYSPNFLITYCKSNGPNRSKLEEIKGLHHST